MRGGGVSEDGGGSRVLGIDIMLRLETCVDQPRRAWLVLLLLSVSFVPSVRSFGSPTGRRCWRQRVVSMVSGYVFTASRSCFVFHAQQQSVDQHLGNG